MIRLSERGKPGTRKQSNANEVLNGKMTVKTAYNHSLSRGKWWHSTYEAKIISSWRDSHQSQESTRTEIKTNTASSMTKKIKSERRW